VTELGRHHPSAHLAEVAAMLDDRTQRLGAFAASYAIPWAITALGPVPAAPAARQVWEKKASAIGAYREMYRNQVGTPACRPRTAPGPPGRDQRRPGRYPRRRRNRRRP
jgi:hypothetical protein